jgi:hypothetical protein
MALMVDARIGVVFGRASERQAGDFVLTEGLAGVGHLAGCACCMSRTAAAALLGGLFLQRARGEVVFFRRVLVDTDEIGKDAVRAALQSDPVVSARFRAA